MRPIRVLAPILLGAMASCYHLTYQLAPRRAESGAPRVYAERCSTWAVGARGEVGAPRESR